MPNSCDIRILLISASFEAFVTRIPVAREIISDGICDDRPSPMVRTPNRCSADSASMLSRIIPIIVPPITLTNVISRPAVASPFTYFVAPSMEPKKDDSCWIFSRRASASLSSMAPVFRSASMAICLPGMASSVNRAVTSDTRSEPLLITTNWIITRMIKIIAPMTRSPPPTKAPNVSTTLPGFPVVRIRRVEETFSEILKIVVNNSNVGKNDISRTSFTNKQLNSTTSAMEMLNASITSSKPLGIGTIKNTTAASKYSATPTSAFFNVNPPFLFLFFFMIYFPGSFYILFFSR